MGQIKTQLQEEITIADVVRDMTAHSGDSKEDVLRWIAKEIIDTEYAAPVSPFYSKVTITLPPLRRGGRKRTVTSKDPIHTGALSSRLRLAARDGWNKVRPIKCERGEVSARDVLMPKSWLIQRLRDREVEIPTTWLGKSAAQNQRTHGTPSVAGKLKLKFPRRPDSWARAIAATAEAILTETGCHPDATKVWLRMNDKPATGFPSSPGKDRGLTALIMPGARPLTHDALTKRWNRYSSAK